MALYKDVLHELPPIMRTNGLEKSIKRDVSRKLHKFNSIDRGLPEKAMQQEDAEEMREINFKQKSGRLNKKPILIKCKVVFTRLGEINTKSEKFDSEVYYECSWEDDELFELFVKKFSIEANVNLTVINENLKLFKYDKNVHWSPKIYIDNAIGEPKGESTYKCELFRRVNSNNGTSLNSFTLKVKEIRLMRGIFYERLELFDFPMDMQELSVTLTSKLDETEVIFVKHEKDESSVSTKMFLSQQEWDLFDYVTTKSFLIYDKWHKYNRSAFRVTSHVARKPGYYLNNAYLLMFIITALGFIGFSIDVASAPGRAQITCVLILTSVNFRWIITQRLPSVPYLTSLDKYAIGNLFFLVLFLVWHSIIAAQTMSFLNDTRYIIDTWVLISFVTAYLLYNFVYILWFLKKRREIKLAKMNVSYADDD